MNVNCKRFSLEHYIIHFIRAVEFVRIKILNPISHRLGTHVRIQHSGSTHKRYFSSRTKKSVSHATRGYSLDTGSMTPYSRCSSAGGQFAAVRHERALSSPAGRASRRHHSWQLYADGPRERRNWSQRPELELEPELATEAIRSRQMLRSSGLIASLRRSQS